MRGLFLGMVLSLGLGLVMVYLLVALGILSVSLLRVPEVQLLVFWTQRNLGLSVLPFGLTLVLYARSLRRLAQRLDADRPQEEIVQLEHLTDVWISLFFGIGVIWTAIGMRSALLYALGDAQVIAEAGAFTVLQRLVDGGILTALSTTILGGAGGYLMRLGKTFFVGVRLNRYYGDQEQRATGKLERLLGEIRDSLHRLPAWPTDAAKSPRAHR